MKVLAHLTLDGLAAVIRKDWLDAHLRADYWLTQMAKIQELNHFVGADSGAMIVTYFLIEARRWHGDVAKAIRKELRNRLAQ